MTRRRTIWRRRWAYWISLPSLAFIAVLAWGFGTTWYWVGVESDIKRTMGYDTAAHYSEGREKIYFISRLEPHGHLARAGLRIGDVLADPRDPGDLVRLLMRSRGEEVTLAVLRAPQPNMVEKEDLANATKIVFKVPLKLRADGEK